LISAVYFCQCSSFWLASEINSIALIYPRLAAFGSHGRSGPPVSHYGSFLGRARLAPAGQNICAKLYLTQSPRTLLPNPLACDAASPPPPVAPLAASPFSSHHAALCRASWLHRRHPSGLLLSRRSPPLPSPPVAPRCTVRAGYGVAILHAPVLWLVLLHARPPRQRRPGSRPPARAAPRPGSRPPARAAPREQQQQSGERLGQRHTPAAAQVGPSASCFLLPVTLPSLFPL
jgi:hypothetical protein